MATGSSGEIVAGLADEESIIVGTVTLDPALKKHALAPEYTRHGRWIAPVPALFKLFPLLEALGARSYARNPRRRAKALSISGPSGTAAEAGSTFRSRALP